MANVNNVYFGGLAEIVDSPTLLTYSFLKHWFKGNSSFGEAMKKLDIPFRPMDISILTMSSNQLAVNLEAEEKILYSKTIFATKIWLLWLLRDQSDSKRIWKR